MGFTMAEKRKITGEFAPRYRKAGKAGKTRIKAGFCEIDTVSPDGGVKPAPITPGPSP
jgi:hypothetical protein